MLSVVEEVSAVREAVARARKSDKTIAFVPTMGALHAGHSKLVECARGECGFVVVSIFVNPTQFGPSEDFARYPRALSDDCLVCERAKADLVFTPRVETIYPHTSAGAYVEVPALSATLEGASRPGHFRGVATVVLKLLEIVRPDRLYLGEKDYQQLLVVRRMVEEFQVSVEVRSVPTVREPDGLAMSSRNRYLDADQRQAARVLSRALAQARESVRSGEKDADRIRQVLRAAIQCERLATLDYAEVADAATLEPLKELGGGSRAVALLAVRIGGTRLIDNAVLTE